jgi:hypothetical protein
MQDFQAPKTKKAKFDQKQYKKALKDTIFSITKRPNDPIISFLKNCSIKAKWQP